MTTSPFASFTLLEYLVGILWMNCQIFQKNTALHWENHIFSAFPAPQVAMTPAMVLEPVTTDMETLFLHFYTNSTQIWKHCFCAAARSTCGHLFRKSVLHTLCPHCRDLPPSTHVEQKPRNPRRRGSIFQKWSCRSSPWPQRLTTWQVLFNSQ